MPISDSIERRQGGEDRLRLVIDTIPALVHTALPDGRLDFFNRMWLDYVGVPLDELLGWGWTNSVHPADVDGLVAAWRDSIATGNPLEYEARVRRRDGKHCWMLHQKVAIRDSSGRVAGWFGSSIDVEPLKRAEERARAGERELRLVIDTVPAHIYVIARDSDAFFANRAVLEYAGLTPDDLRGGVDQILNRLVHAEDVEILRARHGDSIARGLPFEQEVRLLPRSGEARWFHARCMPSKDDKGRLLRWYVIATDVQDRKAREERVLEENIALREEIDSASMFEEIVGTSPALQKVLALIAKVAPTDSTVLVSGETGTGKELVARAIHKRSERFSRPFIAVNCAAVPASLIASELFGHERGAFTGALQRRLGKFELAEGGTIFLDEIGELPSETQVLLLRVLQEREFERVGGSHPIRANVRVIAATNRNLPDAVAAGIFRSDLFYRLSVFPIDLPPLRDRKEDIPLLLEYFIERFSSKGARRVRSIRRATLDLFLGYAWPGNIRELQNVIERSLIVSEGGEFSVDQSWLTRPAASDAKPAAPAGAAAGRRAEIEAALTETLGRISGPYGAAARLGLAASTLESRIRSLKIDKYQFKRA